MKKRRQHLDKCLALAAKMVLDSRKIDANGNASFQFNCGEPDFGDIAELLSTAGNFNPGVSRLNRRKIVSDAFFELAKEADQKRITAANLSKLLKQKENAHRRQPELPFFLHTQVSISTRTSLPPMIKSDEAVIRFHRTLPKRSPKEKDYGRQIASLGIHKPSRNWYYANVFVSARDISEAANIAFRSINLLRAAWNLEENSRLYTRHCGPTQRPINTFRLAPLQTVHERDQIGEVNCFWYQQPFVAFDYPGSAWEIKSEELAEFRKTELWIKGRLRKSSHDYRQFIESNLLNYVSALDRADHAEVFRELWAITESLTGCGRDGVLKYDQLISRASNAFQRPHFKEIILEHLRLARNQMIHELNVTFDVPSVFQLLRIVHGLIRFHLRSCLYFRSVDEAIEYLSLTRDSRRLRRSIRLHRDILKHSVQ